MGAVLPRPARIAVLCDDLMRSARRRVLVSIERSFRQIDLYWHDLRHAGACRLLTEHVDIRTIRLMLGHADIR